MKSLVRNALTFYYAQYSGKTEMTDEDGLKTGEYTLTYGTPTMMRANISASRGQADVDMFGVDTKYSKTIVTTDMNCPINENSRLWIGITPTTGQVSNPHNYRVVRVAKSLNSISYAIDEVDIDN